MFKIIFNLFFVFLLFLCQASFAYEYKDGVYVSSPEKRQEADKAAYRKRDEIVQQYIRDFIIQNILQASEDLMSRALSANNVHLFPQIANVAVQEISLECFKQDETKKIIEDTFAEALDKANKDFDSAAEPRVKADIDSIVKSRIGSITENIVYQKIFESIFVQAQQQQQKIIVMQVAQRKAEFAIMQKRYAAMKQVLAKQYEHVMQEVMKQRLQSYLGQQRLK